MVRQLLTTQPNFVELSKWIYKICPSTKTKIVVNALRTACLTDTNPPKEYLVRYNDVTKQTLIFENEPVIKSNIIDKADQIRLFTNARVIVNELKKSDIYIVLNSFSKYIEQWVINALDDITQHRYLDIVLLFLSVISIKYAVSVEYNKLETLVNSNNENSNKNKQPLITSKTYLDIKGEELFNNDNNNTSLEQLIVTHINCIELTPMKNSNDTNVVSFITSPFVFVSMKHRFDKIMFKSSFKQRIEARDYLMADYLRTKLGLPSLNRIVCKYNNEYHIIENNIIQIDETKIEHNTYYGSAYVYKLSDIHIIKDNEHKLLNLFKHLLFLQIIGVKEFKPTLIINIDDKFYSLHDSIDYTHWLYAFKSPISSIYNDIYKSALHGVFRKLKPTFKKWYKVIKTDQMLLVNMKIYLLSELIRLMDFHEWKFSK